MMADKEEEIIVSRTPNKDTDRMAFSLERWFDGVRVTLLVENNLFAEIKQLVEKKDRFEALEQTRKGLDNIRKDITELKAQRTQLQPEIDKLTVQQRPRRLATYDEQMRKIEDGEKNLTEFLAALETRQKEENDPERRKLIDKEAKAKVLEEKDLEYGQAIKIYQELIAAGFDAKRLTDKVKQLETLWSPPNAKTEFIRAREFIFQEWSKPLDVERLSASMEQAREALKAYKAVDNPLGPRKLSDGAIAHGMRLKGMLENLKAINADEALRIEAISAVIEALEKLNQDAEDYLNKAATKK
jgi:hypothetical protein